MPGEHRPHVGEVAVLEDQRIAGVGEATAGALDRRRIAVDGQDAAAGEDALEQRAGDPAGTERAVDGHLPRTGLQALYEWV